MNKKLRYICVFTLLIFFNISYSQIKIDFRSQEKQYYKIGDTISISISLFTNPKTCKDGMKQAKIFLKGLTFSKQNDWVEIRKGFWKKDISMLVVGNKSNQAQITIMRKVDIESLFIQKEFNLK